MEGVNSIMSMPGLLLSVAAGLLLCVGCIILYRFAYVPFQVLKHMKGPKPSFFFGNYKQMSKLGWPKFHEFLFQKYGPVCGFTPEEKAKRPHLSFIPFAWGPMNCIGMRFALLEIKMALIEILTKYTFVQAPDTEVPLQTIFGLTVTAKNGIYLKIKPRD